MKISIEKWLPIIGQVAKNWPKNMRWDAFQYGCLGLIHHISTKGEYNGPVATKTWVGMVARRAMIDGFRSDRTIVRKSNQFQSPKYVSNKYLDFISDKDEQERIDAKIDAETLLANMESRTRKIFELRFFEGLDYNQIGEKVSLHPTRIGQLIKEGLHNGQANSFQ